MKKILAALTALMMLAAVGCGSTKETEEETKKEKTTTSEKTESTQEDNTAGSIEFEQNDSGEDSSQSGDESKAGSENGKAADLTDNGSGYVTDANTIVDADVEDDDNDPIDNATLYRMTELVVDQFNIMLTRDKQAYFDSVNAPALIKSQGMTDLLFYYMNEDASDDDDDDDDGDDLDDDDKLGISEGEARVLMQGIICLDDLDDSDAEKLEKQYENGEMSLDEAKKEFVKFMSDAADLLNPDNCSSLFGDYSTWYYLFSEDSGDVPADLSSDPGKYSIAVDESTLFGIEVDTYNSNERGTFANLDIEVACGDWGYSFDECTIWINGDESFVMTDGVHIEENTVKGMTKEQVMEQIEDDSDSFNANAHAKTAYNAVATYLADQDMAGRDMAAVIADGDLAKATSPEGLNTLDKDAKAPGDKFIIENITEFDYPGTVYVGFEPGRGDDFFFIHFKTESGVIGQYPEPCDTDDSDEITWGVFRPRDIDD